jgi:hypothetical protein
MNKSAGESGKDSLPDIDNAYGKKQGNQSDEKEWPDLSASGKRQPEKQAGQNG